MTNEQMLQALIKTAVKYGWDKRFQYLVEVSPLEVRNNEELVRYHLVDPANCEDDRWEVMSLSGFLFSHQFAQAVWGNELTTFDVDFDRGYHEEHYFYAWRYHLQQLAITPEQDRIKYAYENMRKE